VFAGVDLGDIDLRILDLTHANLSGQTCAGRSFRRGVGDGQPDGRDPRRSDLSAANLTDATLWLTIWWAPSLLRPILQAHIWLEPSWPEPTCAMRPARCKSVEADLRGANLEARTWMAPPCVRLTSKVSSVCAWTTSNLHANGNEPSTVGRRSLALAIGHPGFASILHSAEHGAWHVTRPVCCRPRLARKLDLVVLWLC